MTQKDQHGTPEAGSGSQAAPASPYATATGAGAGHAQADNVNVGFVAIVGVFAAVLLFVLIVVLQAWFYSWNESERARKNEPSEELQQAIAAQRDKMNSYRVLDPAGKVRAIPIERAMQVEAATLRAAQLAGAPAPAE